MRNWLVSLAWIVGASVAHAQGEAEPLPPVEYRPPSSFTHAPRALREALAARACRIPVVPSWPEAQGVIHGQFDGQGPEDWAAMCVTSDDSSTVLFAWNDRPPGPDTAFAGRGGARILKRASVKLMRAYEKGCCGPEAAARLHHDGLEEFRSSSYSGIWYWNGSEWELVQGAD